MPPLMYEAARRSGQRSSQVSPTVRAARQRSAFAELSQSSAELKMRKLSRCTLRWFSPSYVAQINEIATLSLFFATSVFRGKVGSRDKDCTNRGTSRGPPGPFSFLTFFSVALCVCGIAPLVLTRLEHLVFFVLFSRAQIVVC